MANIKNSPNKLSKDKASLQNPSSNITKKSPKEQYKPEFKILHLDIETSPIIAYVWGLFNQNIATNQIITPSTILCFAAKWHGKKGVMYKSIEKSTHEEMMKHLHKLLDEADVVVHYNGKKFDIPRINREFTILRLPPPERYAQIDLLQIVRAVGGYDSNKLEWVAKQIGISQKIENSGMSLWDGCMKNDTKAWREMKQYNVQDTTMLEELYLDYLPWIRVHPNVGVYKLADGQSLDRPTCTNCGSVNVIKKGLAKTKTQMYQRYRCVDCGTPMRGRNTVIPKDQRKNILVQEV